LLVVVALPMSVVALSSWRRDHRAPNAAIVAGALLIGWIVVQLLVLRSVSWLQPICAALGGAVMSLGVAERKEQTCT
jgi:CHASE2 domain-containing sensor protein